MHTGAACISCVTLDRKAHVPDTAHTRSRQEWIAVSRGHRDVAARLAQRVLRDAAEDDEIGAQVDDRANDVHAGIAVANQTRHGFGIDSRVGDEGVQPSARRELSEKSTAARMRR